MHLNWDGDILQSANVAVSKCNFTADEMAVLRLVSRNAAITQCELARAINKSESPLSALIPAPVRNTICFFMPVCYRLDCSLHLIRHHASSSGIWKRVKFTLP